MRGAILVTGGASGIGRAIVEAVIADGWRAVVLDLPGPNLDAAAGVAFDPALVRCTALDVSDEAAVAAEVAAVERDFGPIEGVVNSAGIARDQAMLTTSAADFRRILEVNVLGSFVVAREAARAMRGRGGAIVTIASVSGIQGNEGRVAYGASKGAVITMTRVMAVELAPFGIRVNVIAPARSRPRWCARSTTSRSATLGWRACRCAATAARRRSRRLVFLLDRAKSGYVTGQTLAVDGGFTIAGILTGTAAA